MADIPRTLAAFSRNGFKTFFFKNPESARAFFASEFAEKTIGIGGSMTVKELGLYDTLSDRNTVYWHWAAPKTPDLMAGAQNAEVYILSANALSETGEIVNIDGSGNRVAASIFGPNRKIVVFVCGENKIEPTLEAAISRAKNVAAPLNARRLKLKTPCAQKADKCYSCASPQRICNATCIISRPTCCQAWLVIVEGNFGY